MDSEPEKQLCAATAPFYVVLNAGSGRNNALETRETIERVLQSAGREVQVLLVKKAADIKRIAQQAVDLARERGGVVVAAGGDGTINAVAQVVLPSGCLFGVIPQGTFNYFGRVHGISQDTEEALDQLLDAHVHPSQVGMVNDRIFLVNASVGLYPQLLEDREAYKQQYGRSRMVALWSGIVTILKVRRRLHLEIEHDGKKRELRTPTLFVGNNELQLRRVGLARSPDVEAGRLVAIALRDIGSARMLGLLLRGLLGRLGTAEDVLDFSFVQLQARPRKTRPQHRYKVAMDGEIARLAAPLVFRVAPERLQLLVPSEAKRKEIE